MARKLKRPNRDGWWLWFEDNAGDGEEILVTCDGAIVASDDEWEREVGRKPKELWSENYWEGTDTTQKQMPGTWKFLREAKEPRR
jgi:hypothetical protein